MPIAIKISLARGLSVLSGVLVNTSVNVKLAVATIFLGGALLAAGAASVNEIFINGCDKVVSASISVNVAGVVTPKEFTICQGAKALVEPADFLFSVYGYNGNVVEIVYQDGADGLLKRTRIEKGQNTVLPLYDNFKNHQAVIGFKGLADSAEGTKAVMTAMLFGANLNASCKDTDSPTVGSKDKEVLNYYNIYKKGTISGMLAGELSELSDDCVDGADGQYLREYFCKPGSAAIYFKDDIKCEFGCDNGACLKLEDIIEESLKTRQTNLDSIKK